MGVSAMSIMVSLFFRSGLITRDVVGWHSMSIIDINGVLSFYDMEVRTNDDGTAEGEHLAFERKVSGAALLEQVFRVLRALLACVVELVVFVFGSLFWFRGSNNRGSMQDAWDMVWAEDNPQLLAMMEKTRMYVAVASQRACLGVTRTRTHASTRLRSLMQSVQFDPCGGGARWRAVEGVTRELVCVVYHHRYIMRDLDLEEPVLRFVCGTV